VLVIALGFLVLLVGGLTLWVGWLLRGLPDEAAIKKYRPYLSTEVRDARGELIFSFGRSRNRLWRPLKSISPWLVKAVITSEDDTFYEHAGIRVEAMRKAFWKDLKAKRWASGASTITQQLAKNAFLTKEKTITRKIKEIILAKRMEKVLSKRRILELYLNEVEWGDGLYGAEAAGRYYFGKSASDVNLPEAAMLASMLPNPKYYNPFVRWEKVKRKQRRVLRLMRGNRVISREDYEAALEEPLALQSSAARFRFAQDRRRTGNCFDDTLIEYLEARLGTNRLYGGGLNLVLTLDMQVQRELEHLFGSGGGELLLVAREGDNVRAFTCIGGTPSASRDVSPQTTEWETASGKAKAATPDTAVGVDSLASSLAESLEEKAPTPVFPYHLVTMSREDFLGEELILVNGR